jgi:hypothetical protein
MVDGSVRYFARETCRGGEARRTCHALVDSVDALSWSSWQGGGPGESRHGRCRIALCLVSANETGATRVRLTCGSVLQFKVVSDGSVCEVLSDVHGGEIDRCRPRLSLVSRFL